MNCNNPFSFCKMKKSLLEGVETGNLFPESLGHSLSVLRLTVNCCVSLICWVTEKSQSPQDYLLTKHCLNPRMEKEHKEPPMLIISLFL